MLSPFASPNPTISSGVPEMLAYLRSARLLGHIDGTDPAPSKMVASSSGSGAEQVPNPAYDLWYDQDQMVLSGLLASLSEELLQDVVEAMTAQEAGSILDRMFSSTSRARAVQLRIQLATTKKNDLPAANYFRRMKGYAQTLAAIGMTVQEAELISYILSGLGSIMIILLHLWHIKLPPLPLMICMVT